MATCAAMTVGGLWMSSPAIALAQSAEVSVPAAPAAVAKPARKSRKLAGVKLPAGVQFTNEAGAQASCPADTVVWANFASKVYHASGSKYYGKTKHGAFACTKVLAAAGFRASKT